jgi:integrase
MAMAVVRAMDAMPALLASPALSGCPTTDGLAPLGLGSPARPARDAHAGYDPHGGGLSAELPQLVDKVRVLLKQRHYAARTENAYVEWIHRFFRFCAGRTVASLGEADLRGFLEHLTAQAEVTQSGRTQARSALLTLFHGVLGQRFDCSDGLGVPLAEADGSRPLSAAQLDVIVAGVDPSCAFAVALLRATDLRPAETLVLRVRDVDLDARCIYVRDERGRKPMRVVPLPDALVAIAAAHLATARTRHQGDLEKNAGYASLPDAVRLADPLARRAFAWQWLFAGAQINRDPLSREGRRRHLELIVVQRALAASARAVGITHPITLQTLRVVPRGAAAAPQG